MLLKKLSLGWLVVFLVPVAAQQIESAKLPETLAGQRVAAYLKAFNSGDEQLVRGFFQANVSPAALQQRPIDLRVEAYHEMRGNIGTITLRRVLKATEENIAVLVQGKDGGWREITFEFEADALHRFLRLGVEDVVAPSSMTAPPRSMTQAEVLTSLEKYLDGLAAADDFSGTVLIAKGATPIFQKAYGLASKEYNIANRVDTKFNLGSINKVFTQVAIGQLLDQGKLTLDDKLGKYLPDYPNPAAAE
jgi:D-alanyl-D-alanine carboxypeptidase